MYGSGKEYRKRLADHVGFQIISKEKPYAIIITSAGFKANNCWITIVKTNGHRIPLSRRGLEVVCRTSATVGVRGKWKRRANEAMVVRDVLNGEKPLTAEFMQSINPAIRRKVVELICIRSLG